MHISNDCDSWTNRIGAEALVTRIMKIWFFGFPVEIRRNNTGFHTGSFSVSRDDDSILSLYDGMWYDCGWLKQLTGARILRPRLVSSRQDQATRRQSNPPHSTPPAPLDSRRPDLHAIVEIPTEAHLATLLQTAIGFLPAFERRRRFGRAQRRGVPRGVKSRHGVVFSGGEEGVEVSEGGCRGEAMRGRGCEGEAVEEEEEDGGGGDSADWDHDWGWARRLLWCFLVSTYVASFEMRADALLLFRTTQDLVLWKDGVDERRKR